MSFEICLNTSTIKPQPLLYKIRLAADAGFAGIELWINDIYEHVGRGGEVSEIERALGDYGLFVPCMIALRGWGEAEGPEYRLQLDEAKRRLELAHRLGSPYVVATPPRAKCDFDQIASRYKDLLEIGRAVGVKPTFEHISFFGSAFHPSQALEIMQKASDPDATVILDAFHHWNSKATIDDLRAIPGDRIAHYHIDDANPNIPATEQKDPDRVMPGDGVIDLKAEIDLLREKNYQGAISLELFNPDLWEKDPREVLRTGFERVQALVQS